MLMTPNISTTVLGGCGTLPGLLATIATMECGGSMIEDAVLDSKQVGG